LRFPLISSKFVVGTALVLLSTYVYTLPDRKLARPVPIRVASFEKTAIDKMNTPRVLDEVKMNLDPMDAVKAVGLSTSRPASPMVDRTRGASARNKNRDD
jgi:UDP-sugar transporter A1/2/3